MDQFYKMDVFFVVTTIAVVIVAVLICIALFYIVRLLSTFNRIANEVEEETQELRGDLDDLRIKAKKEGLRLGHLVSFFGKGTKRIASRKKRSS